MAHVRLASPLVPRIKASPPSHTAGAGAQVDPLDELLRLVGEAKDQDAEDERRLGDPTWRNRPSSYPRR